MSKIFVILFLLISVDLKTSAQELLKLNQILQNVILYHPEIRSAQLEQEIAKAKFLQETSLFDPSLVNNFEFNRFNSSSEPGVDQENFLTNNKLEWQSPWGPKLAIGHKIALGDIKTPFAPTGDSGEFFTELKLPLLRNSLINSNNLKSNTAKINAQIAEYKYFLTKLKILNSAVYAYWQWILSVQTCEAEEQLLEVVNAQLNFVNQQITAGSLAQFNSIEASREVQRRQARLAFVQRQMQDASFKLAKFLWTESGDPLPIPLREQSDIDLLEPQKFLLESLADAKLLALHSRPEFKILESTKDIIKLEKSFARNQILPMLDAYLSQGFESGQNSIGPTFQAGFNFSLPLRLRMGRALIKQAESKIQQMTYQEKQLIQSIFLDIEDAFSQINTAFDRYVFHKNEYDFASKLEQAEKTRFELGDSTLFLLIQRQRASIESKIDMLKANADYNYALANFDLLQAKLLGLK